MPRTALFVIDIQHALLGDSATEISHAQRIRDAATSLLSSTRQIIDKARSSNQPPDIEIVTVQHEEPPDKGDLQRGTKAWGLVFAPREGDKDEYLVSKTVRDTFESNPRLAAELKARDVGTIVAFGIQSECCVLSTCNGALAAGFGVVLLRGAHSTYDADGETAVEIERRVERMVEGEGAVVVEWEKWVAESQSVV